MLVSSAKMQRLERAAFDRGIAAADLMEQAGLGLAEIVRQFFPVPGSCLAFCGKGNNAGDALVALRHLHAWGWRIGVDLAFPAADFSSLPAQHHRALSADLTVLPAPTVILDGLLGLGAQGEPRGPVADAIRRLNTLRREHASFVLAIDLPSGLDGETGLPAPTCVVADLTAAIAAPKTALVADEAIDVVGRLALVSLPELAPPSGSDRISAPSELRSWLPLRPFDTHKGRSGRVSIVAGSAGFTGAARLASAATVRAGAGLVTLYVKPDIAPILAASCLPEVMVQSVTDYRRVLEYPADALVIGPGLGSSGGAESLALLRDAESPVIVDADALNTLARDLAQLKHCRGPRLLTPHPGEMQRLFPRDQRTRRAWLDAFLAPYPVHLLLKGSRTILGAPDGRRYYNTTGHPGMASGGMGDVLSGVCAALVAQCDHDVFHAGVLGAWLCGRAAECAIFNGPQSPESLAATDVIDHLGAAFRALRTGF